MNTSNTDLGGFTYINSPFRVTVGLVYAFASLTSILINVYIVYCLIMHRTHLLKKFNNCLLLHLGVSNLLSGALVSPAYAIALLKPEAWTPTPEACDWIGSISSSLILLSLCTVVGLNLDKYKTITLPLKYSTYTSSRRIVIFTTLTYAFAILTNAVILLVGPRYRFSAGKCGCSLDFRNYLDSDNRIYKGNTLDPGVPSTAWQQKLILYSNNTLNFTSLSNNDNFTSTPNIKPRLQPGVNNFRYFKNIPAFILLFTVFILPAVFLFVCYCKIFQIARSHRKGIVKLFQQVAIQIQAPIAVATAAYDSTSAADITNGCNNVITADKEKAAMKISRPSSFVEIYAILGDTKAVCTIAGILGTFCVCYLPFGAVCTYELITRKSVDYPRLVTLISLLFPNDAAR